jgi:MFS family permease
LWMIVSSSLRQRLTPPEMLGRVGSTNLFIAAGGNCAGALLAGGFAAQFGITAPYWVAFVVAVIVSVATWRVFSKAAVAEAYGTPRASEANDPAGAT